MLAAVPGASLATLVAWVPILASDRRGPDEETLALVSDARARHFWDAGRRLPPLFAAALGLPERMPAWDVYLLYEPGVRWDRETPPTPAYWQHQLGDRAPAPRLDAQAMLAAVESVTAHH